MKGLYDYGPPGCAIKANLLALWRRHFVLEDNMLEIDGTSLTPEVVLETSGHVAKFQDYMVRDVVTHECYRADHLLKERLEKLMEENRHDQERVAALQRELDRIDDLDQKALGEKLREYGCRAPDTGNEISEPFPFNLMFPTQIGPTGLLKGYLRPETAQGIFVNFARLLEYNAGRLPFAAAQIGLAFRNEIAPRAGLLRVREFTLAEIEHFVRPGRKEHAKFSQVADVRLRLYPRERQRDGSGLVEMTVGKAVERGIIANQTLGYYLARTAQFLWLVGLSREGLRFRQHMQNEMAHYAADCWDAEALTSYGWVEIAGHADRSAYDLTVHEARSKQRLRARESYAQPRVVRQRVLQADKAQIGRAFKQAAQPLLQYLESLEPPQVEQLQAEWEREKRVRINLCGKEYVLDQPGMLRFREEDRKVTGEEYTPHVIEPSFGIGRIIYAVLEQCFRVRPNDAQRVYLSLPPWMAPVKCSVLPLVDNDKLNQLVPRIVQLLTEQGISSKVDDTGTAIGRRYARTDEIGIPFGITIDFDTLNDDTVTLRERDSMEQVRVSINEVASLLFQLVDNRTSWAQVREKYPIYTSAAQDKDE